MDRRQQGRQTRKELKAKTKNKLLAHELFQRDATVGSSQIIVTILCDVQNSWTLTFRHLSRPLCANSGQRLVDRIAG